MCVSVIVCIYIWLHIWLYIYDTQTYTICWYMYIHTWHVYTWFVVDYVLWSQQWEERISDWYLWRDLKQQRQTRLKTIPCHRYAGFTWIYNVFWLFMLFSSVSKRSWHFNIQEFFKESHVWSRFLARLVSSEIIGSHASEYSARICHAPTSSRYIMIYPDEARQLDRHAIIKTDPHLGPEVVFSWNEGQSWYDFELSSMPVEVRISDI